jgi:hypothetical protein
MLAAIGRTSTQSLRRRFFVPKKGFSEREMTSFLDIYFESHVALVLKPSNVHPDMSSRTMSFDAIENGHPIA